MLIKEGVVMLEIIKNYWDEGLSVLAIVVALVPFIADLIATKKRKIYVNVVDYSIVTDAEVSNYDNSAKQKGTLMLLAVNLFIPIKSFFVETYEITAKLKSGTTSKAIITDGSLTIHRGDRDIDFSMPSNYNFNLHKEIICEQDNIRIFKIMFVDANIDNIDKIESIEFNFTNKKQTKTITVETKHFPKFNKMKFLSEFEEDVTIF